MTEYEDNPVIRMAETMSFNVGSAFEYLAVLPHEDGPETSIICLERAIWHLQREIRRFGGTTEEPTPLTDAEAGELLVEPDDKVWTRPLIVGDPPNTTYYTISSNEPLTTDMKDVIRQVVEDRGDMEGVFINPIPNGPLIHWSVERKTNAFEEADPIEPSVEIDLYPHKENRVVGIESGEYRGFFVEATRTLTNQDVEAIKERLIGGSTMGWINGPDDGVSWRARLVDDESGD